jgi:hypothetical protein
MPESELIAEAYKHNELHALAAEIVATNVELHDPSLRYDRHALDKALRQAAAQITDLLNFAAAYDANVAREHASILAWGDDGWCYDDGSDPDA